MLDLKFGLHIFGEAISQQILFAPYSPRQGARVESSTKDASWITDSLVPGGDVQVRLLLCD